MAGRDLAESIADHLEEPLSAAAKAGAESGGGGKRARGNGHGTLGSTAAWLIASFFTQMSCTSPGNWTVADDVILRAAYLTVGGAEVLSEQEFAVDVRCACASAWYCVTLMLSYDCTFSVFLHSRRVIAARG